MQLYELTLAEGCEGISFNGKMYATFYLSETLMLQIQAVFGQTRP